VLVTGLAVLIGAAAAGERARTYEAAVLRVLGASRGRILASFALRAALTGALAGLVALGVGALAGWGICRFVMDVPFRFEWLSALVIVAGGMFATLVAGMAYAVRPLSARPAGVLRSAE
jgi:putative ABC transport system permease protein